MKKSILFFLLGFAFFGCIYGQKMNSLTVVANENAQQKISSIQSNSVWQKDFVSLYGDEAMQMCDVGSAAAVPTMDGGLIFALTTFGAGGGQVNAQISTQGAGDWWIVKLDSSGSIKWKKRYGGTSSDYVQYITPLPGGYFLVTGYTYSSGGFVTGSHGASDGWVMKIDSLGTSVWKRCFGGANYDFLRKGICRLNGNFLFIGTTLSSNNGDVAINNGTVGTRDMWVFEFNPVTTVVEWTYCFGGIGDEEGFSVVENKSDSSLVVIGKTTSATVGGLSSNGDEDGYLVFLDKNGNMISQKLIGGSGLDKLYDGVYDPLLQDYFFVGHTKSVLIPGYHNGVDLWLVRTTSTGAVLQEKAIGGTNNDGCESIKITQNQELLVAVTTLSSDGDMAATISSGNFDVVLMEVSKNFSITSSFRIGGANNEFGTTFVQSQTNSEFYFITGWTNSSDSGDFGQNHGDWDGFVIKIHKETPLSTPTSLFGLRKNGIIYLWWNKNKNNTERFEVERGSTEDFFSGFEIFSLYDSDSFFVDSSLVFGKNYYRLKVLDANGNFYYSNILIFDVSKQIRVWNNNGVLSIENAPTDSKVRIFDLKGALVDKDNLSSGMYIVQVILNNGEIVFFEKILLL